MSRIKAARNMMVVIAVPYITKEIIMFSAHDLGEKDQHRKPKIHLAANCVSLN
jgi:hypothetical protein